MFVLRTSLRPRPLTVGSVWVEPGVKLFSGPVEVVVEGLSGQLSAPLWRHDPNLGRGYLIFSQVPLYF